MQQPSLLTLTSTQSAHQVVVKCNVKRDAENQPNLLNKLTATVERKWELIVVLKGINSISGVPALEMTCGNFLHLLKKVSVPWLWTTPTSSFS